MKKILLHINSMGKGGAERVMANLANMFVADDYEVVLATEWFAEDEYILDEKIRRVHVGLQMEDEKKSRIYKLVKRFTNLHACIKAEKPDVLLAFSKNANFRAILAALGMKVPVVVSERSDPNFQYAGWFQKTKGNFLYRFAAGNVFQTTYARDFFCNKVRKKSNVIVNPLNEKYLNVEAFPKRREELVTVGRISEVKNQQMMIRALAMLQEKFPELTLAIYGADIGEGTIEKLERLTAELHLEDKVHFMGNSNTLEKEIKDAACFLMTSTYEGMPNALMEAMAMGIPCVATNCPCGGARDLMSHHHSGLLVEVHDVEGLAEKITWVLEHKEEAEEMGQRAQYVKEMMHPEKIYHQWKEYLLSVTNGAGK